MICLSERLGWKLGTPIGTQRQSALVAESSGRRDAGVDLLQVPRANTNLKKRPSEDGEAGGLRRVRTPQRVGER